MSPLLRLLWVLACLAFSQPGSPAGEARAEVVTDGTVGSRVRLSGDFEIGSALGRRAGGNLFHSFEKFSLGLGERATFSGPSDITTIISRVTGGERSDIDGTVASAIPGADFVFFNPAGVMFGPGARLDLQGSFHVSTADELRFADGVRFSATNLNANSFSVAPPEAFGFLRADPMPINVGASFLQVPTGEALSIVGGDINIGLASIRAEAGPITLSAVDGPGEARLGNGAPVADRRADITMRNRAQVSTTGDGGGTIRIRAGRLVLTDSSALNANNNGASNSRGGIDIEAGSVEVTNGAFISASTGSSGDAGTVTVEAEQMTVDRAGSERVTGIVSDVRAGATGRGGVVIVSAAELEIRDGGEIRASTFGEGNAGVVDIHAFRLLISGTQAPILMETGLPAPTGISNQVEGGSTGDGGTVMVRADAVDLHDGVIRSVTFSQGKAGTVTVTADRVTLRSGGQISSSTLEDGTGKSGDVVLTAHETLSISGQSRFFDEDDDVFPPSGVFASTESERPDARAGGIVTVTAPVIRLADRGEIASEVFGGGAGGAVEVQFTELLEVDDAEITTKANTVDAGDITVQGQGVIDVRNGGQISTTVFEEDSEGNAGDITIDPRFIILDAGRIQANGRRGQGGNIDITVENLIQSPDSVIEALSDLGIDGTVVIRTPETDLSGGLVVLEGALLDAASQLRERCAARRDIGASSFTGVGRGGLPPSPDGPLAGAYLGRAAAGGGTPGQAAVVPPERAGSPSRAWAVAAVAPCVAWPEMAPGSR